MIAIADAVGDDWPERARSAARALSGSEAAGDDSLRVMLLQDIGDIFAENSEDVIASADMVVKLNALEHRPWPEFKRGMPITTRQLASLLAPFGIAPKVIWHHGASIRGYEKTQFLDAFSRYGGDRSVRSSGMAENSQSLRIDKCKAGGIPYTSESGSNPQNSADPYGLTDRSPPGGANSEIPSNSEPPAPDTPASSDDDDIEREPVGRSHEQIKI